MSDFEKVTRIRLDTAGHRTKNGLQTVSPGVLFIEPELCAGQVAKKALTKKINAIKVNVKVLKTINIYKFAGSVNITGAGQ